MRKVIPLSRGSVTVEYLLVATGLMLSFWLVFVGGPGAWNDPDRPPRTSAFPVQHAEPAQHSYSTSVIKALDDRQRDFANDIYQP